MKRTHALWTTLIAALLMAASGCGGGSSVEYDDDNQNELASLEGTVTIDGSSTVFPITEGVAVAFGKQYAKVKVPVAVSGTGGGFKRFVTGETEISNASRPIKPEEFAQCQANGVSFVEIPVAYDGLSIVVHPQNDWCDQLTVAELQRIFVDSPDKPKSWRDVRPEWPDREIKLFIPGTDSGTFDYFKEVMDGHDVRSDVSASEDDNTLVTGVSSEKGAIGFFGCAYYFENKEKLAVVPIVNSDGQAVTPTPETIESGEYNPFSRPLFIYVNAERLRRPEVKTFTNFYVEQAPEQARSVGYVALPPAVYDTVRDIVGNRREGTCFVTPEGEKRSGSLAELYQKENLTAPAK